MKNKKLKRASGGMSAHVENVDANTVATINNSKEIVKTELNGKVDRKVSEIKFTIF